MVRRDTHGFRLGALAAVTALVVTSGAAAQSPGTLKIVVGSSAGGGYDTYARILARHIGRHIPGQPAVIVQNMPGAAGLKAIQYLDSGAPQDGSVITALNPGMIAESLLNADKVRFKFPDVAWIGSITRDQRVCYPWAATSTRSWSDRTAPEQFQPAAPQ